MWIVHRIIKSNRMYTSKVLHLFYEDDVMLGKREKLQMQNQKEVH